MHIQVKGVPCRYDVETGRQVRSFAGHRDRITDVGISADGKWLLSSSLDGTLRVWDIPAARTLQVRSRKEEGDLHLFQPMPGYQMSYRQTWIS